MKMSLARNILSAIWLGGFLLLIVLLFFQRDGFVNESGEIWKRSLALVAPMVAFITTYLFGIPHLDVSRKLPNPMSFYAAVCISLVNWIIVFGGLFGSSAAMIERINQTEAPSSYLSALSIVALNYFFLGLAKDLGQRPSPGTP